MNPIVLKCEWIRDNGKHIRFKLDGFEYTAIAKSKTGSKYTVDYNGTETVLTSDEVTEEPLKSKFKVHG